MGDLTVIEIKAFVPARDFSLSKQFYEDLGFTIAWSTDDLAYVRCENASFLLQNFYVSEHAGNFMMHLLVEDVDAWWRHVQAQGLQSKYEIMLEPPADRSWGLRDFVITDPTGVLWRIGQNKPAFQQRQSIATYRSAEVDPTPASVTKPVRRGVPADRWLAIDFHSSAEAAHPSGRLRRISSVAAHSVYRLLSEPTAGTQPCRREPLFMPISALLRAGSGLSQTGGKRRSMAPEKPADRVSQFAG